MSTEPDKRGFSDQDQEQLVAYLDGELNASQVQVVERRLSQDPAYRKLLSQLERSWDMLDQLPQPTAGESFTRTTVEMVASDLAQEIQQQQPRHQRRRVLQLGAVAIGVLGVAWVSYALVDYRLDRPNRQFLLDLPVIERVDQYQHIEDLQFLENLAQAGLFDEPVELEDETSE